MGRRIDTYLNDADLRKLDELTQGWAAGVILRLEYIKATVKVIIGCPIHSWFEQLPNNHLKGHGCPRCNRSIGEDKIALYLDENNIKYVQEKRFEDLKYKSFLRFDFFLEDYNLCIEYDGAQYFKSFKWFGGEEKFNELQIKDCLKTEYCENNGIGLLRISFKYIKTINNILIQELNI